MAAPSAAALVRQVQAIAESPELLDSNEKLDQVASFLDCFLDHSDSAARLRAAHGLAHLFAALRQSDKTVEVELRQAPRVLAKLRSQADIATAEDKELQSLLEGVLSGEVCERTGAAEPVQAEPTVGDELRLECRVSLDDSMQAAVRQSVVKVGGVVSVTFETLGGENRIVVRTRTAALVSDPDFVSRVCSTVSEQLPYDDASVKPLLEPPLISAMGAEGESEDEMPMYLDDSDDEGDGVYIIRSTEGGAFTIYGQQPSTNSHHTSHKQQAEDDEDADPKFICDGEDEVNIKVTPSADPSCSSARHFFTTAWMAGGLFSSRKLADCEEDPRLVARLHRAKLRVEKRRREEQMRIQQVLSVITPLRSRGLSDAARKCREAAYAPRGVE